PLWVPARRSAPAPQSEQVLLSAPAPLWVPVQRSALLLVPLWAPQLAQRVRWVPAPRWEDPGEGRGPAKLPRGQSARRPAGGNRHRRPQERVDQAPARQTNR